MWYCWDHTWIIQQLPLREHLQINIKNFLSNVTIGIFRFRYLKIRAELNEFPFQEFLLPMQLENLQISAPQMSDVLMQYLAAFMHTEFLRLTTL